jgi:hypothetical protein
VAEETGRVVGTVRYWPVSIGGEAALMLGPIAIAKDRQGQGIALALMQTSLARARALGHRAVVLVGDEPYYGRAGFKRIQPYGRVTMPGPVEFARLLGLSLVDGALEAMRGEIRKSRLDEPVAAAGCALGLAGGQNGGKSTPVANENVTPPPIRNNAILAAFCGFCRKERAIILRVGESAHFTAKFLSTSRILEQKMNIVATSRCRGPRRHVADDAPANALQGTDHVRSKRISFTSLVDSVNDSHQTSKGPLHSLFQISDAVLALKQPVKRLFQRIWLDRHDQFGVAAFKLASVRRYGLAKCFKRGDAIFERGIEQSGLLTLQEHNA